MATFAFKVIESRAVERVYWVEAETEDLARALAYVGETTCEEGVDSDYEVIDRSVIGLMQT